MYRFLQKYPEYPKPYEAPPKICLDEVAKELSKYMYQKVWKKGSNYSTIEHVRIVIKKKGFFTN